MPGPFLSAPRLIVYCMIILSAGTLHADAALRLPYEHNFGTDPQHRDYLPDREIELWARNQNLILVPDDPGYNLQDFEAETIPPYGKTFELGAPGDGRVYLHLDLVAFRPLENGDIPRVRWLQVFVNDHLLATLYRGGGAFLESPQVILVEREHTMDRRLQVYLRPSPGDGYFAIWDAYVTKRGTPTLSPPRDF